MHHDELVAKFSQTVGVEKAESLIEEAADELRIETGGEYTDHELADICETIQESNDGYVRLVANEIRVYEQAHRRFDALLDEITDPIVTVSFEDSMPIVEAMNPAFEEAFDCDASAIGRPLPAVIDACDERGAVIARWFRSDHDGGIELTHRVGDERRTFLFRSIVVTRETGDVDGYGIYTDITERKRRERQLEHQNEQLERFASVVSHDLRNPLTIAEGNLELALDAIAEDSPAPAREYLRNVSDAHQRMGRLIEDLLTLARQGQIVSSPEPVSLEGVVYEAWSSVSSAAAELEVDDAIADDGVIEADRPRLRQLFENLFRNSVEHGSTSSGSQAVGDGEADTDADIDVDADTATDEPTVTVRVGTLSGDRRGFYVADDGPGIDPDDRETVFEHGYTTDSSGTGFGLAIVKAIVDAHEWSISVTESRDGGARFEISGVTAIDADDANASS